MQVVGRFCPTVGLAKGWPHGAEYGPRGSAYGLGVDNALEYEVQQMVNILLRDE
ncbi:uncharacterized protein F4817DRAFT_354063 [Daldinia loculata]|uniref:uncharacterized protein n=1 Tax=Daldinia loculata TaxID=103429 RepID=UPI0020C48F9F|nr:uncharacterized protein F4817DRAFT_354063 [Daldinia loculata]KAI1642022.1 hypothetical protein F4817DRAFT_354063 [Daldinia loculata]